MIAVSPLVAGHVGQGPDRAPSSRRSAARSIAAGVASLYEGLIDGIVVDADDPGPDRRGIASIRLPTLMEGADGRRALAEHALEFAASLG